MFRIRSTWSIWNGSGEREILEAETSTRSQGTIRKDLILSERDEFQGVSVRSEPVVGFHTVHDDEVLVEEAAHHVPRAVAPIFRRLTGPAAVSRAKEKRNKKNGDAGVRLVLLGDARVPTPVVGRGARVRKGDAGRAHSARASRMATSSGS